MPIVTCLLLLVNVGVFVLQTQSADQLVTSYALWPLGSHVAEEFGRVSFQPWQLVTSAFLHASPSHLLLNMLALWMFGRDVERALGGRRFLMLYLAAVLAASFAQLAVDRFLAGSEVVPTLGASGGVFGVLLAYGTLFPRRIVLLLFPPIPMPAWLFVTLYGLLELGQGVLGLGQDVAHFAHVGGMAGAWLLLRRWRYSGRG